jgi:arsenical pump membrane protein
MLALILTISAFALTVLFIVHPIKLRLGRRELELDYAWGSLFGAAIILLGSVLTPGQALDSLLGRPGFSPYTIIILFMSLAYITISLDSTGFFEFAALKFISRSKGSKARLFFLFFFLSSLITLFTSNDIVILTLTPIIFYFGKHAKVSVLPYLIAEFFAANIWSMFLYIGNPTNIIVAMASGLDFYEYTYWMALPTLAAGLLCLGLLYLAFRKDISGRFNIPKEIDPSHFIKDRRCAFSTFSIFLMTMAMFILSPLLNVDLWWISFVFALALLLYDSVMAIGENADKDLIFYRTFRRYVYRKDTKVYQFRLHFICDHMPWKIIPFLVCLFIMVEGLLVSGFIDLAAAFVTMVSPNIMAASLSMGFLSSLAANVVNNQPMTILFTKILESPNFALAGPARSASIYSLIIGSNLGANLTIIGALAGIMWAKIIQDNNMERRRNGRQKESADAFRESPPSGQKQEEIITYRTFAKYGFMITPLVILAACIVIALEFMIG